MMQSAAVTAGILAGNDRDSEMKLMKLLIHSGQTQKNVTALVAVSSRERLRASI